ncbi:MAG TPA: amidohydrolase family protein [Dinghuibacter sp.]|uniref:amidohydrolase family protein n=1 Tax=Dinghuibacter sp. TaxID=2024697 RepID=UPI002B9103BB|nr:amidohydrolase family protein [Dinghuibacter sp.]HTJ13986.1 amidohydrolase family protein [Dinghuibacter sp.]
MGYWKIQADGLFDGYKIDADRVLVGEDDGTIAAVVPEAEAGSDVQRIRGLLCPGFVNTHCHLELSHMAGVIPEDTGLVDFLLQVLGKRGEIGRDPLEAARQADRAMQAEGIVAVGDISNNISTLPVKAASALYYHTFVETMGFLPASAESRLAQSRQVYDAAARSLGAASLVAHAPYSVSRPLFEAINRTYAGKGGIFSIHNQESEAENQFYREGSGDFLRLYAALGQSPDFFEAASKSSLATYLPWISEPSTLLLVHDVASDADDIRFAMTLTRQRGQSLYWCLCPGANRYIQRTLPPVMELRALGCTLTLGTDSLASNQRLSILSEILLLQEAFPAVPLEEMLGWATRNGAQALGMGDVLGSFTPGARPGVLVLEGWADDRLGATTGVRRLF